MKANKLAMLIFARTHHKNMRLKKHRMRIRVFNFMFNFKNHKLGPEQTLRLRKLFDNFLGPVCRQTRHGFAQ